MGRFLYPLVLGAFAVGMEGMMIAGLLPAIAEQLGVGLSAAGWLVIGFSATYAVAAPLAAALAASFERRAVLLSGMAAFALGNLACALAPGFGTLVAARLWTALAAALFMPAAMAYAGASAPPEARGRVLGLVGGGVTASLVLGVPLGTWLGTAGGIGAAGVWRWPFLVVAALGAAAFLGVLLGVPRRAGAAGASVGQRLSVLGLPAIRRTLAVTVLWSTGAFAVYTYVAPVMERAGGLGAAEMPAFMLAWGVAASIGSVGGGRVADRIGAGAVAGGGLLVMAAASAALGGLSAAPVAAVALMMACGVAGWAVNPAQQARLIAAEPAVAQVSLSFHASAIYLGSALGSLLGSVVVGLGEPALLGWVAAACALAALSLLAASRRPAVAVAGALR
jgi:predicted MFS family arabinose efflux permease